MSWTGKVGGFALFVLLFGGIANAQAQPDVFPITQARQLLFLGNSITYSGEYIALFESYFASQQVVADMEFVNLALPSETVSGLSEDGHAGGEFPRPWLFSRLSRILAKTDADIAFVCYGMNDGIYLPLDSGRFEAYKEGMIRLHAQLTGAGVKRILVLTPPVHDDRELGLQGYNLVLDRYASWLMDQREKQGWEVIDVHFPMRLHLSKRRETEPDFKLAEDGIHPGEEGHWLIARELLRHFGFAEAARRSRADFLRHTPGVEAIYPLVRQRQDIMKDAWLTFVGHDRPGMNQGLPLNKAKKAVRVLERNHKGARLIAQ